MKKLFVLFFLTCSFNAWALGVIRQTKESDAIKCQSLKDIGNRENVLTIIDEKIVGNKRELIIEIQYFHCQKKGENEVEYKLHDPREMISYHKLVNGRETLVQKELTYARYFMIYADNSYEYSDMFFKDTKSFILLSVNKNIKTLTLGSGLTSTLYYGDEFETSEFYEFAAPTYFDFN